jgi:hypothetical protein
MKLAKDLQETLKDKIEQRLDGNAGLTQKHVRSQISSRTKAYTNNVSRNVRSMMWEELDWDFGITSRIADTEPFVARAFRIKTNLFLKEGFDFVSSDPNRARYIKNRFKQMENATGKPFYTLFRETIHSLQMHRNAMWVKARKKSASGGKIRQEGKRFIQPVAGYFLLPIETVQLKRDEYGKVVKIRQKISNKQEIEFRPEDVIHFYIDKRPGFSVGTPPIIPVEDDVRALRRFEEQVELLFKQTLVPILHAKVGDKDSLPQTRPDGTNEIDEIKHLLNQMSSDGSIVTPGNVEMTTVEGKSKMSEVVKILEYFKQRIYTGLGVSSVDMGEADTSNRSTASQMSRNLVDEIKADQECFIKQFEFFVIRELLLESTFGEETLFDEDNLVHLKFNEIDIEARNAKENHLVDMYTKNVLTHDETREGMGRERFMGQGWTTGNPGEGFDRTNYGLFSRDTIVLQSIDEPGTSESKAVSKAAASNSVSNKNQPANQHGKRGSAKTNRDQRQPHNFKELQPIFLMSPVFTSSLKKVKNKILSQLDSDIKIKSSIYDSLLVATEETTINSLSSRLKKSFNIGLMSTNTDILKIDISKAFNKVEQQSKKYVSRLIKDIKNLLDISVTSDVSSEQKLQVKAVFDSLSYRAEQIDFAENIRAFNYGVLLGGKASNSNIVIDNDNCCEKCKVEILKKKNNNDIIYEELPPYHPWCECKLKTK